MVEVSESQLISTSEAAGILGVKEATIYSYVSRGLLHRAPQSTRHRGTRFHSGEVLALREERRRRRAGVFEVAVETTISHLTPAGSLSYRGHDVQDLAGALTFEQVAELLWGRSPVDWEVSPAAVRAAETTRSILSPAGVSGTDDDLAARVRLAVALLASDPQRAPDDWSAAPQCTAEALNAAVNSLGAPGSGTIAERLATALGADHPELLDIALICLADHELASSTIAARVSAGTGSHPLAVLLAGLNTLPGDRHARASRLARSLLEQSALTDPATAVNSVPSMEIPGFGHIVYRSPDPRFEIIGEALAHVAPEVVRLTDSLALEVLRSRSRWPNIDLALAGLELGLALPRGSGELIFTIARMAGMTAHAVEEQDHPLRFRPRANYTGPLTAAVAEPTDRHIANSAE